MKPDETPLTIALNDTRPKERTTKELNTFQILVTETNINAKAVIESSDIALLPNVDTHTKNTRVTMVMASIESSDDDVKLGTTPNNALNDMTPKENTKEELNACKVFVTETNIKAKAPIKSSNIASLPNVTNNTK